MRKSFRSVRVLSVGLAIAITLSAVPTHANAPSPQPASPSHINGFGDDGILEVGVEWIQDYTGVANNLSATKPDAESLYNGLGAGGWTKRFNYGNSWAWEEDWKRAALGGTEANYIDSVDLAYFSGHGGNSYDRTYGRNLFGLVFGRGGNTHDDTYATPGDAYRAYGDGDMEWVGFSACQILNDASVGYWANSMYGAHLLMGFKTNMGDVNFGYHLANRIRWGWTMTQAWFGATDVTNAGVARVVANEPCHYNDRASGSCADSYDSDWWYWDHAPPGFSVSAASTMNSTATNGLIDPATLGYEMPVYNIVSAAPNDTQLNALAGKFGVSANTPAVLDGDTDLNRITDNALDLTVDQQGMFQFLNKDKLWGDPSAAAASPAPAAGTAISIATNFLNSRSLLPADAVFASVTPEVVQAVELTETSSISGATTISNVQVTPLTSFDAAQQVVFNRQVVATSGTTPITFTVQGPGAKLRVYVGPDSTVAAASGGWRSVDNVAALSSVSILRTDQIVSLYNVLGESINLAPVPLRTTAVTATSAGVSYYEQPMGVAQSSLLPVFVLDLNMRDETGGVSAATAYVPASARDLAPLASVITPTDTAPVQPGQTISLTAVDASQSLASLGLGSNLTFTMGTAPFTYTWRLQNSSVVIGTGRSLSYKIGSTDFLNADRNADVPLVIALEVTDAAGHQSLSNYPFFFAGNLPIADKVFMPTLTR